MGKFVKFSNDMIKVSRLINSTQDPEILSKQFQRRRTTNFGICSCANICDEKEGRRIGNDKHYPYELRFHKRIVRFRFKLIKWWAQSFLIGIEKVIGGFRDDDGVVRRLENFRTMEMSKMCKVP